MTFQRPWGEETNNRIGRYDLTTNQWDFVFYTTDTPESQNGGRVNLTDIVSLGGGNFRVIESDSEGGPDAAIRRLYDVNLTGAASNSVVTKTLSRDLLAQGDLPAGNGSVLNSLQGIAITLDGREFVLNDNDGLDDNVGETQLVELE